MNESAFDALTNEQQGALREASAAAVPNALEESRFEDDEAVPDLCLEGMTLTVASESDLSELRAAYEPVYEDLAADPTTKSFIEDITGLKDQLAVPPEAPGCPPEE